MGPGASRGDCEGDDGILHFGGNSVEGPWDNILQSNITGCYNVFEAARKKGVKRIVFASSNHAMGFYPRHHRIGTDVTRAAGQPLRRQQGIRRGGRRALCRQARDRRHLPADRQFRRQTAGSPPALDLAEAGRPGATSAGSGSIIPISISRSSTARRTTSAHGGTITAPTISTIAPPVAPRSSVGVAGHGVVSAMPSDHASQPLPLLGDGLMPTSLELVIDLA